jgi:hypothetical protein
MRATRTKVAHQQAEESVEVVWGRHVKAKYGRNTPLPVGYWIDAMDRLKKAEREQARIEAELGRVQIESAYVAWSRLRPKKLGHGGLGDEEIAEIAREHPEVDRDVYRWLSKRVKLWKETDNTCSGLGSVVYGAYKRADLGFLENLTRTLRTYVPTRAPRLREILDGLANTLGNPLPLTLTDLTKFLNLTTKRELEDEDKEWDRGYVARECKNLEIRWRERKSGPTTK